MPAAAAASTPARRRPGRPRRPPLDDDQIARAALEIIDESGWQACTMNALAGRLGVRAPSLYHYVDGQQAVIDLVRSLVVSEIDLGDFTGLPWDRAMYVFGVAYYRAFTRHPNTIQVLSTTQVRDRATVQLYERFLSSMTGNGWVPENAFEALLGLEHLALGFAFEWNADELMLDAERTRELDAPLLTEIVARRSTDAPARSQPAFAETSYLNLLRRYIEMFRGDLATADASRQRPSPLGAEQGLDRPAREEDHESERDDPEQPVQLLRAARQRVDHHP